jgi:hypothetical protein
VRVSKTFFKDSGTRFVANVYFDGHDKRGMRQGEKAAYLQYGTNRGMTATHFATRAAADAKSQVNRAMEAVLESELKTE